MEDGSTVPAEGAQRGVEEALLREELEKKKTLVQGLVDRMTQMRKELEKSRVYQSTQLSTIQDLNTKLQNLKLGCSGLENELQSSKKKNLELERLLTASVEEVSQLRAEKQVLAKQLIVPAMQGLLLADTQKNKTPPHEPQNLLGKIQDFFQELNGKRPDNALPVVFGATPPPCEDAVPPPLPPVCRSPAKGGASEANFIMNISRSPCLELLEKIATLIAKEGDYLASIQAAMHQLQVGNMLHFTYDAHRANVISKMYVGDTLISIGEGSDVQGARLDAAHFSRDIFEHIRQLPDKTLEDLKRCGDREQVGFFRHLGEATQKICIKSKRHMKLDHLVRGASPDGQGITFFHVREDVAYFSKLVIHKVLICEEKRTTRKKFKKQRAIEESASRTAFHRLRQFAAQCNMTTRECRQNKSNNNKCTSHSLDTFEKRDKISKTPLTAQHVGFNAKLMENSMSRKFAIIDPTSTMPCMHAREVLQYSAQYCRKICACRMEKESGGSSYEVFLGKERLSSVMATPSESKTKTQLRAYSIALANLQNTYYVIRVKSVDDRVVRRADVFGKEKKSAVDIPIPESNVGHKMLKMMGWKGGGLGKTEGITQPIQAVAQRYRKGLGFESQMKIKIRPFHRAILRLLKDYMAVPSLHSLLFDTDFETEELIDIQNIAEEWHLEVIRGKQLRVRQKPDVRKLLEELVRAGGSTPHYELVDRSQ